MALGTFRFDGSNANARNLVRLCLLRAILIVGLVVAALVAQVDAGQVLLADGGVLLAIGGLTLVNMLTLWRVRLTSAITERELLLQLLIDVALVTLVLYRTGGSTNPFVSYYLVPLTIASATLRLRYTCVLALVTLAAYTALLQWYRPFAPFSQNVMVMAGSMADMDMPDMADHSGFNAHVFGMWLNFLASAALITFFVGRMSQALREQDQQLAEQHERLLQKEQIVAMGALAAGAAHELGTPLATMTLLADELAADLPAGTPASDDVALLREQLQLCRGILASLRQQAMQPDAASAQSLEDFGRALVDRLAVIHPGMPVDWQLLAGSACELRMPLMVRQAIMNLLNNAAEAAASRVELSLGIEGSEFRLDIRDDGPGVDPEIAERLGQPFVTSKAGGMGLGFFLSHANVNQLGGSIHIQPLATGGTLTRLRLPAASAGVIDG